MNERNGLINGFNFNPENLKEAMDLCKMIADSDLAPKDFKGKPGNVMVAIQMGLEVGLKPMQALQNIAVINGRPVIWGDGLVALVDGSGTLEYMKDEWNEATQTATCRAKRIGKPNEIVKTFSMVDAKKAGLEGKAGPWTNYPKRMCEWRAKSWVLRAGWADVLKGVPMAEEAQDFDDISAPPANSVEAETIPMPKMLAEKQPEAAAPESPNIPPSPEEGSSIEQAAPQQEAAAEEPKKSNNMVSRAGMKSMSAKFPSKCNECSEKIDAGEPIYYDGTAKKAYHIECPYVPE